MGRGLPVAMHSRMAVWCSDTEMFCGEAMIRGLWGSCGLGPVEREQKTALVHMVSCRAFNKQLLQSQTF